MKEHMCSGSCPCRTKKFVDPNATPRVAVSVDDLRLGQVVATLCYDGSAGECIEYGPVYRDKYDTFLRGGGQIFILSDPPPSPVTVSREAFDALEKACTTWPVGEPDAAYQASEAIRNAARALVAEVRGTDQ